MNTFEEIEHHLLEQLKHLDVESANPDRIIGFDQYKAVYDTLIALKQAQALERIATQLEDGQIAILADDGVQEKLSRISSVLRDK